MPDDKNSPWRRGTRPQNFRKLKSDGIDDSHKLYGTPEYPSSGAPLEKLKLGFSRKAVNTNGYFVRRWELMMLLIMNRVGDLWISLHLVIFGFGKGCLVKKNGWYSHEKVVGTLTWKEFLKIKGILIYIRCK